MCTVIILLLTLELWCILNNLICVDEKTVLYFYSNKDWTGAELMNIVLWTTCTLEH